MLLFGHQLLKLRSERRGFLFVSNRVAIFYQHHGLDFAVKAAFSQKHPATKNGVFKCVIHVIGLRHLALEQRNDMNVNQALI